MRSSSLRSKKSKKAITVDAISPVRIQICNTTEQSTLPKKRSMVVSASYNEVPTGAEARLKPHPSYRKHNRWNRNSRTNPPRSPYSYQKILSKSIRRPRNFPRKESHLPPSVRKNSPTQVLHLASRSCSFPTTTKPNDTLTTILDLRAQPEYSEYLQHSSYTPSYRPVNITLAQAMRIFVLSMHNVMSACLILEKAALQVRAARITRLDSAVAFS